MAVNPPTAAPDVTQTQSPPASPGTNNANLLPPPPDRADPPPPPYAPTHYDGTLPGPVGEVAQQLATLPHQAQRTQATELHTFLDDPTSNDLRDLNGDLRCFTIIIGLPHSHKLRVLYGLGFGTAGIGQQSPLSNKILSLYSEGGAVGPPPVLLLDSAIRFKHAVLNPTDADIDQAFQAGHEVHRQTHSARALQTNLQLLRLVPIPAYLVYDGLENDLEAAIVYERLRLCTHDDPWKEAALALCRSCMVGSWRIHDTKPYPHPNQFNQILPPQGRTWGINRFRALFPTLQPQGVPPQAPPPPAAQNLQPPAALIDAAQGGQNMPPFDANAILQLLQHHAGRIPPAQVHEEKKDDEDPSLLPKVSTLEKQTMRAMCGLDEDAPEAAFPKWYRDLFNKHQDDKDKAHIVCSHLESTYIVEDGEVPLYPALIKTILKRDWTAGDAGKKTSFLNAAKGISPFAMFDFTEDDVAVMNQDTIDIASATSITTADIKAARSKLKAQVPSSTEDFLKMLRAYTNLLFALFSNQCPLYKCLYSIVKSLRDLSKNARDNLSSQTKASMLWIILLQSRRFSQGKMIGDEACLAEFTHMLSQVNAKQCSAILHDEIPKDLITAKTPCASATAAEAPAPKKPRPNQAPHNADLKNAFAQPLKDAGNPGLAAICQYCGTSVNQLIPEPDICRTYAIMGYCKFGPTCRFKHITASPIQAKKILSGFKRFLDDPLGLKGRTPQ